MTKSLEDIKSDLLKLSESIDCNKLILDGCYIENDISFSIMYDKKENKFFKLTNTKVVIEI